MADRVADAGFTLIEALIAMAILAMAAVAFLGAAETHAARIGGLEERVVARWLAADALTARRLGLEVPRRAEAAGRVWSIELVQSPTLDDRLMRIDVSVRPETGGAGAVLTGFGATP